MAATEDLCRRLLTSYGGTPVAQLWCDYLLWELLLNDRPDLGAIVELGTWKGGFARYLSDQARWRGMDFRTYDAVNHEVGDLPGFYRLDVFRYHEQIGEYLREHEPLILLCDNGNKPRELRVFTPYLHEGSIVVVHDWLTEVQPEDIPAGLTPIHEELCDSLGSMSRVFAVTP